MSAETSAAAAYPRSPSPRTRDEVARLLAQATQLAQDRDRTAAMRRPVERASDTVADAADLAGYLPVAPELAPLLPWPGLRRGATVAVPDSTSLLLMLLAGVLRETSSWAAVVGLPSLGAVAANEFGVDLRRLALVPDPGAEWPRVVGALIDGIDLVVIAPPPGAVPMATARGLAARARQRGAILLPATAAWPEPDLTLEVTSRTWSGLGQGWGRLRGGELTVRSQGRGAARRPRTETIAVPPGATPLPPSLRVAVSTDALAAIRPVDRSVETGG